MQFQFYNSIFKKIKLIFLLFINLLVWIFFFLYFQDYISSYVEYDHELLKYLYTRFLFRRDSVFFIFFNFFNFFFVLYLLCIINYFRRNFSKIINNNISYFFNICFILLFNIYIYFFFIFFHFSIFIFIHILYFIFSIIIFILLYTFIFFIFKYNYFNKNIC